MNLPKQPDKTELRTVKEHTYKVDTWTIRHLGNTEHRHLQATLLDPLTLAPTPHQGSASMGPVPSQTTLHFSFELELLGLAIETLWENKT